jgi:DNA-binding LacI/PurR family transcriptional regulator
MGRAAADLAVARLNGSDIPCTTTVLPTSLILRGSERLLPAF